jgi:hypothetical protein
MEPFWHSTFSSHELDELAINISSTEWVSLIKNKFLMDLRAEFNEENRVKPMDLMVMIQNGFK